MTTKYVTFPDLQPSEPQGSDLLAAERAQATFRPNDLTDLIYGAEQMNKYARVQEIIEADPAFDKSAHYYLGREDLYKASLRKEKRLAKLMRKHGWGIDELQMAEEILDIPSQFMAHRGMFVPSLMSQADDEQKEAFLKPALRYQIIGCYAQTELGHGSNVQGLETTATYIPETDEFEINSPYLTAAKWWVGALGITSNYAVVMARLISNGKDHGPHLFVVQLRDLKTHKPLPGRTIGDIGPKLGYNSIDNGFLLLNKIRIPRFNMLSKYAQVEKGTGRYTKPPNARLAYGTMVLMRVYFVLAARRALARAATISIRYSAIRRQFVDPENPKKWNNGRVIESPVIDYVIQQYRLFPVLAQAYACHFAGLALKDLYETYIKQSEKGDFSLLAYLHASSSGLKSLTTTMAVTALEDCRLACGGHGYSKFSGFVTYSQNYAPNSTWEGDNYLLTQQVARYLFKTYRQLISSAPLTATVDPTVTYLQRYLNNPKCTCPAKSPEDFRKPEIQLQAFGHRAAYMIAAAVDQLDNHGRTWNSLLVDIAAISRAHCQYVLVCNFIEALQPKSNSQYDKFFKEKPEIQSVLTTLRDLFALHTMQKEFGEFLSSGYLSPTQSTMVKDQVLALLKEVRPNAVALVDSFRFSDYTLQSALGRYDGKVYETLCEWASREPLNSVTVDVNLGSDTLFREERVISKL
ncbi:5199_t:CDS:2 [Paraglomus occultum]|uniref:Acyl-coenzyme A oxidase n=1 Tax=Paraglomus occultum TaxID=144539 RepID=A0A9N9CZB0_9GLOM|nr:5199_t:CDS:2 [Paraglomus occultum]